METEHRREREALERGARAWLEDLLSRAGRQAVDRSIRLLFAALVESELA
jgi:hypothetical protein